MEHSRIILKYNFFWEQNQYRRRQSGLDAFFAGDCLDKWILIDLFPLRMKYNSGLNMNIPNIQFKLLWTAQKCPEGHSLSIYSFSEHVLYAEMGDPTGDVTIV